MFNQESLIFIWITGVIVKSYSNRGQRPNFRLDASLFIRKIFQHQAVRNGECQIALITAKPRAKITPTIYHLISRTGLNFKKDIKLLAREDIMPNRFNQDIPSPDVWIRKFNTLYSTDYTSNNTVIIDCNKIDMGGNILSYGRVAGLGYQQQTILLKPITNIRQKWICRDSSLWQAKDLRELSEILCDHFRTVHKFSKLPLAVFLTVRNVLEDLE